MLGEDYLLVLMDGDIAARSRYDIQIVLVGWIQNAAIFLPIFDQEKRPNIGTWNADLICLIRWVEGHSIDMHPLPLSACLDLADTPVKDYHFGVDLVSHGDDYLVIRGVREVEIDNDFLFEIRLAGGAVAARGHSTTHATCCLVTCCIECTSRLIIIWI